MTLQTYKNINIPIHIISQPPHQYRYPESLYFFIQKGIGSIEELSVKQRDFSNLEKITKDIFMDKLEDRNYHYIADIFCDNQVCSFGTQVESYYYDDNHLSRPGAERLRGTMENILLNKSLVD